jgi:hypothetical protein
LPQIERKDSGQGDRHIRKVKIPTVEVSPNSSLVEQENYLPAGFFFEDFLTGS